MNNIRVTREQVENDYPTIYQEFIENLRNSNSINKNIDLEKTNWFYSWGSFVKKAKTDEERVLRDLKNQEKDGMLFPERLDLEFSKIRVNITMEGGNFVRGDRAGKDLPLPESITKIVAETTKISMLLEQKEINNQNVINSIPEIDDSIVPRDQIDSLLSMVNQSYSDDEELDVDTILEKISSQGIESLTNEEKEFLDNQSN